MKRILLYIFLYLGVFSSLTGCYDDQTSDTTFTIPEIEVDTVGLNAIQYIGSNEVRYRIDVQQFETLKLSFPVSQTGVEDPNLSYEWKISMAPEAYDNKFMTISTEKDLEYVLSQSPNATPYLLWYQVTDNNTGLVKGMLWRIQILAPFAEGLLVAHTSDGENTDLSFIASKDLTLGHSGEPVITHNIYSAANQGTPIEGLATQMLFWRHPTYDYGYVNQIMVIGKDFYQQIDNGFLDEGRNLEVSYDNEITFEPTQMAFCSGYPVLVNKGVIFPFTDTYQPFLSLSIPANFTHPRTGEDVIGEVDKYIAARGYSKYHTDIWAYGPWACWYDKKNGMFLHHEGGYPTHNAGTKPFPIEEYTIFDPTNCPNLDTKAAGVGFNDKYYFLMENLNSNTFQVYAFGGIKFPITPYAFYEIPASENAKLKEAIAFHVSKEGQVIYFATKHEVYVIQLDATVPEVKLLYSSNDEITHFSMFSQAFQVLDEEYAHYYQNQLLRTHHNLLFVGTWNGSTGTLTTLPITNPATGIINAANKTDYTGFDKILTVIHHQ
jgi:hypothetical protein